MLSLRQLLATPLASASLVLALAACSGDDGATSDSNGMTESESQGSESQGSESESESESGDDPMTALCGTGAPTMGSGSNLMETWGAPCTADQECVDTLGEGGVCLTSILDIYLLPQGYCSKLCALPDGETKYVEDDAACGAGLTCIGLQGWFEACAQPCTSDDECQRDGYTCQTLPQIGAEGEPRFCLMAPNCTMACIDNPDQTGC